MELPTKLLIGATGLILVVALVAINPTILIVLGLLGLLGIILALLAGKAATTAALTTIVDALCHNVRILTHTVYGT